MKKWMKTIRVASAIALAAGGTAAFAQQDVGDAERMDNQEGWMETYDSDEMMESDVQPTQPQTNIDVNVNEGTGGSGQQMEAVQVQPVERESRRDSLKASSATHMPFSLKVGGGIEGQGQALDDVLAPGPLWTASVGVQPLNFLGIELGYTGSAHELDTRLTGENNDGAINGADIVRNGGHAVATIGLPTPVIQPYAVGGVGIDRYDYRAAETAQFQDDTAGRAPIGGGLRAAVGPVTADARATYNVLFEQEFAPQIPNSEANTYNVSLNLGARF